jgi:hypothetical protein
LSRREIDLPHFPVIIKPIKTQKTSWTWILNIRTLYMMSDERILFGIKACQENKRFNITISDTIALQTHAIPPQLYFVTMASIAGRVDFRYDFIISYSYTTHRHRRISSRI